MDDFALEECADFETGANNESAVDLNKAFYFDEDLEMDLKQVDDPIMEEAHFDLKSLSIGSKQKKSVSFSPIFSMNSEINSHASEKLLAEAVDEVFIRNKFKSFEIKKKRIPVQTVLDKRCKSFPPRGSPANHSKAYTPCNEFGKIKFPRQTIKDMAKSCKKKKIVPMKYLSRSSFSNPQSRRTLQKTTGA